MAQNIINYGASPNDGEGDQLRTAFIKTEDNFDQIWAAGPVGSNISIGENAVQVNNTNGNLTLRPNGVGVVEVANHLVPTANNVFSLGSANLTFRSLNIGLGGANIAGNLRISTSSTKASNDPGVPGQIAWDSNYIYVCVAADTWKRAALETY